MRLEEEIHQEKFESEHQKAALNVLFTSGWLYHWQTGNLKPFGITPEQFNVLRILRGSHPKAMMLAAITCRMLDRSSNATRLVEKLRAKGLVRRDICASNRRQVDIRITPRGLELLNRIDHESEDWQSRIHGLSRAEAQELNRLLDKFRGEGT